MSAVKGCSQLKSLATLKKSGTQSGDRHVRHFQVASLEIERTRRLRDRSDAVTRMQANDQRLDEIDSLLRGHYESLGLGVMADGAVEGAARAAVPAPRSHVRPIGAAMPAPESAGGSPRRMVLYGR